MLHEQYDAILATRNNAEFDKEIGALPGSEMEKVSPLLRGITDNLRTYLRIQGTDKESLEQSVEDYLATDIHIESLRIILQQTFISSRWGSCGDAP